MARNKVESNSAPKQFLSETSTLVVSCPEIFTPVPEYIFFTFTQKGYCYSNYSVPCFSEILSHLNDTSNPVKFSGW